MLIVVPPKRIDLLLRVVDRCEPMYVQAFFTEPPVERFDGGIVGRLAPATEVENDAVGIRPEIHRGTDELRTVVTVDALGQAALKAQSLECCDDITSAESWT